MSAKLSCAVNTRIDYNEWENDSRPSANATIDSLFLSHVTDNESCRIAECSCDVCIGAIIHLVYTQKSGKIGPSLYAGLLFYTPHLRIYA